MFRHIFPNILSPIIVQGTMGLASAILSAAALGFLGLGAIPPEPEWGAMLGDSYKYLSSGAWWAVVFPGVAIMLARPGLQPARRWPARCTGSKDADLSVYRFRHLPDYLHLTDDYGTTLARN